MIDRNSEHSQSEVHDFNPFFECCGVKMRLTEICHDAGMRAVWDKGEGEYHSAYYATLQKLIPGHPALREA